MKHCTGHSRKQKPMPYFCIEGEQYNRPPVNPAQLLGVAFDCKYDYSKNAEVRCELRQALSSRDGHVICVCCQGHLWTNN